MKTGNLNSIVAMATELQRRMEAKRDYIAPSQRLTVIDDGSLMLTGDGATNVPVLAPTDHFRRQLSAHYKIPFEYIERVRTAHPSLYAETLNTHLHREPATRMVRTLDGKARAFLSDRYRPLDNHDLVEAVLPALMEHDNMEIVSIDVSDNKFYLKALFPKLEGEIKVGEVAQMGLTISNSEVGAGTLLINPFIFTLWCKNGATMPKEGMKRTHLGRKNEADDNILEFLSDQTRRLDDATFFAKVRDVVKGTLTDMNFQRLMNGMREAMNDKLDPRNLQQIVEVTGERFGYNESTKAGILAHLINDAGRHGLSRYGLLNAITRQSQDETDYELATQMESHGGMIIELGRTDWKAIAEAA